MAVTPPRNLPANAEPWGRSVDERITAIEKTSEKNQRDTTNSQKAVNSTVTKLSEQVAAIDELTQELAAQQATLQAQQSQLSAQVAQIQSLVGAQIRGETLTATQYANYNNAYQTCAPVTFTAPAGYSRAYVMTVCSASFDPDGLEGVNGALQVLAGVELSSQQAVQTENGRVATVTASYADFFSLDPGEQFTCAARVFNPTGAGWVQTSAIAIFLR